MALQPPPDINEIPADQTFDPTTYQYPQSSYPGQPDANKPYHDQPGGGYPPPYQSLPGQVQPYYQQQPSQLHVQQQNTVVVLNQQQQTNVVVVKEEESATDCGGVDCTCCPDSASGQCCRRFWLCDTGYNWYSLAGKGGGWIIVLIFVYIVAGIVIAALLLIAILLCAVGCCGGSDD
ncbi:uncharacterized protein LOC144442782 [Glandiceps talaboti]